MHTDAYVDLSFQIHFFVRLPAGTGLDLVTGRTLPELYGSAA